MPTIIQTAFLAEALLNIPGIIASIIFPSATLNLLLVSTIPSSFNPTSILLTRALGVMFLALTPPLLLAYPNTTDAAGKRRIVYWTLGLGEGCLVPLLLWEAFRASDEEKVMGVGVGVGGWSRTAALMGVASLLPLLLWRIYVFTAQPSWFLGVSSRGTGKKIT